MNCEDCVYSDIADWEQNGKTGKAKAIHEPVAMVAVWSAVMGVYCLMGGAI